jgi:hypothetical protein
MNMTFVHMVAVMVEKWYKALSLLVDIEFYSTIGLFKIEG